MDAKKIAEEWCAAYNERDSERFANLMAEDIEYSAPAMNAGFSGRLTNYFEPKEGDPLPDRSLELLRVFGDDRHAIFEMLWYGTSSGTSPAFGPAGQRVQMTNCVIIDINDDGLISRGIEYVGSYEGVDLSLLGPDAIPHEAARRA
ncbi:nuclear transport factor 2 family protein [Mycolicibacterium stellerae]|uniref:nuclear transport factor 2 family protein n=1 Tax=Mycolicibacterium stellerae TaxID=2358193 RepID=UPI000F0BD8C2|nr:nuclear transport factor 2 family protein [Mycolicibacterium stellerae]